MKSLLTGLLLVALGVVFLLSNAGILPYEAEEVIRIYWPLVLVLIGGYSVAGKIYHKRYRYDFEEFTFPLFLIVGGLILTGNRLGWFGRPITFFQVFWPFVFIYIGLSFLSSSKVVVIDKKKEKNWKAYKHHSKKRHVLIGSIEVGKEPWGLEDSSIRVGVGEGVINLTNALIKEGETKLEVTGHIGSIILLVPSDLAVNVVADLSLGSVNIFRNEHSGTPGRITYRSDDYYEADKKVDIYLSMKIGEIIVKKVD